MHCSDYATTAQLQAVRNTPFLNEKDFDILHFTQAHKALNNELLINYQPHIDLLNASNKKAQETLQSTIQDWIKHKKYDLQATHVDLSKLVPPPSIKPIDVESLLKKDNSLIAALTHKKEDEHCSCSMKKILALAAAVCGLALSMLGIALHAPAVLVGGIVLTIISVAAMAFLFYNESRNKNTDL